jgi:GH24 family phage-related lysozyme (muramidase)
MNLVPNWRRVVAISLSFWMQIVGLVVLIFPELKYAWTGEDSDPHLFWWLCVLLLVAGVLVVLAPLAFLLTSTVRAEMQPSSSLVPTRAAGVSEKETLDLAVPFILKKEGIRLTAYLDGGGVPTICGGLTTAAGIKVYIGMPSMTMKECTALMWVKVAEYRTALHRYLTVETIQTRLPATRDTAYTSLTYNIGIGAAGNSTAVRRLNAGQLVGGCEAITWFNKDGGRVVRGLFERRKDEKALCMIGV